MREVARYLGVQPSTVSRWMKRAPSVGLVSEIPTQSSRPHFSPRAVDEAIVDRILVLRHERRRCAEVIREQLRREGLIVSLSTVKRTLHRHDLIRPRSPWKKYHLSGERPIVEAPGTLVEMDTVHLWVARYTRTYLVTLIDVWSRWAYVRAFPRLTTHAALKTAREALVAAPFTVSCFQTDHGPEFTKHFTRMVEATGIRHRHTRVRKPNDNAHIERFNRTIQDDLKRELRRYRTNIPKLNYVLTDYLMYYNDQRLHLGLGLKTPSEVLRRS